MEKIRRSLHCKPFRASYSSAKFGTCTVVSVNGTLVEDKKRRFKGECAHFSFNKCPIYAPDGASAKFSTNSHGTDYSVVGSASACCKRGRCSILGSAPQGGFSVCAYQRWKDEEHKVLKYMY